MKEMCDDNRFELIEKYKKKLIEGTNIETSENEMSVIDDILFRFWQMGWLNKLEKQIPKKPRKEHLEDDIDLNYCPCCNVRFIQYGMKYCGECGQALDWNELTERKED